MKCKNALLACTYSYRIAWDADSSRTSIASPPLPPSSSTTSSATPSFGSSPTRTPTPSPNSLAASAAPSSSCTFVNAAYDVGSVDTIRYYPVAACSGAAINGGKLTVTVANPRLCNLDVVPSYGSFCVSSGYTAAPARGSNLLSGAYGVYTWTDVPCSNNDCCVVVGDKGNTGCTVYVNATFSISAKAAAAQEALEVGKAVLAYLLANPLILAIAGALLLFLIVMRICSESTRQCLRRICCCKHEEDDSCMSCFRCCCCCSSSRASSATVASSSYTRGETHSSASTSAHPHPLQFVRRKGEPRSCDVCETAISTPRAYRCFKCDYDECIECAVKRMSV